MSEIQTLELTIEQAKNAVKLKDQAERLIKNRDFKAVFEEEYFDSYVRNTSLLLAEVKYDNPKMYEDLVDELEAVGRVRGFIQGIFQKAREAEKAIVNAQSEIDLLREEGEAE
jgi:hypothetical protein